MSSFLAYCINTVGYLRLVTISDLVDIAILTFLFYKLIGLFRRTNAAKVARAVLLIVVAMWLAYQFYLHALNFLLSRAVELGFLALVIIFPTGDPPVFGADRQQQCLSALPLLPASGPLQRPGAGH